MEAYTIRENTHERIVELELEETHTPRISCTNRRAHDSGVLAAERPSRKLSRRRVTPEQTFSLKSEWLCTGIFV